MKPIKFPFKNTAVLTLLIISFVACDKDYATLDSDISGNNNFGTDSEKHDVIAFTKKLQPVQTNNLPVNMLGVYKDPLYGLSTASFVSQLSPRTMSPVFGTIISLDSVVLTVPYFSRATGVDDDGNTTYKLDSIFGNGPVKLSIYENNFFLRSFDPSSTFDDTQKYYSDKSMSSTSSISDALLEGRLLHEIESFVPSADQIVLEDEEDNVTERLAPALRIKFNLDDNFWSEKILDKEGAPELSNINNFQNYFRGLYFKAESIDSNGSMMLLNFAATTANVTLYYQVESVSETNTNPVKSTYVMTFSGNKVNFLSNDFNFPVVDGDAVNGDEKLYVKAGEGSVALINLFGGTDLDDNPEQNTFEAFKNDFVLTDENGKFVKAKRLVNEANLVFFVDQELTQGQEPERIYLFDAKNNIYLADFVYDGANVISPVNSRAYHLGRLQRENGETSGQGVKYKIRITEHINNLLLRDSTNVTLGLAVTGNINLEESYLQQRILNPDAAISKIPVSSIISPRGTVLYGNNTANESKKLYLELFYSEPNN